VKKANTEMMQSNNAPPITIWVHGTFFLPNAVLPKFFYCPLGLNLATNLDKSYHHRTIAETLAKADPKRFPINTFYLFGWQSKLSFSAREQAGKELYTALIKLVVDYQKEYNQKPVIRIIAYSHGGNVVLNIAEFYKSEDNLKIDELILLACPVQERTKQLTQSTLFSLIISLFSALDTIQILDPQGLYPQAIRDMQKKYEEEKVPFFSERAFKCQPNLIQVEIKLNGRGLFHIEFMLSRFLHFLPTILNKIEQWQKEENNICKQIYLLQLNTTD
jgi:hypothetical protein